MDLLNVPKNTKEKIIGVYKYSSCNVNSLVNALEMISVSYKLSSNFSDISNCYKIILPGVGNMKNISKENMSYMSKEVKSYILEGGFIYGICLGCQLLFESSDEAGSETLGIFKGKVEDISNNYKLKLNIGYKNLNFEEGNWQEKKILKYFKGVDLNTKFYFLHRFYCNYDDEKIHNLKINVNNKKMPVLFFKGNVLGTQFHPELSKKSGLNFLKNVSEMPL
tara:strand:- start:1729 stop:2394 length:666 start_codon:yes stop_codon:yes gene_type:complete